MKIAEAIMEMQAGSFRGNLKTDIPLPLPHQYVTLCGHKTRKTFKLPYECKKFRVVVSTRPSKKPHEIKVVSVDRPNCRHTTDVYLDDYDLEAGIAGDVNRENWLCLINGFAHLADMLAKIQLKTGYVRVIPM